MNPPAGSHIAIVGAGPAGISCALHLARLGVPSLLIDKAVFPRDKICGDALSGNVIYELEKLGLNNDRAFTLFEEKIPTAGIKFIAPNLKSVYLKMYKLRPGFDDAGYVSPRLGFDHFLWEQARKEPLVTMYENTQVQSARIEKDGMVLTTKGGPGEVRAAMVAGADGAHSIMARLTGQVIDKKHYSAGLRQYWENVTGFDEGGPIELHFYKNTLPGYFWIFPLPGNRANVGIGIRSDQVSKKKLNLKQVMHELITTHPLVAPRFIKARALEEPKGFGLPLGSRKIRLSGERFILLGDAASLIDPFSGEGIGNAMISGRLAALHILSALQEQRFDAGFNQGYDEIVYKKLWAELSISHRLQKLLNMPWIFNFIVNKAQNNKHLHSFLELMLEDSQHRRELAKPSFYYKLLFRPNGS